MLIPGIPYRIVPIRLEIDVHDVCDNILYRIAGIYCATSSHSLRFETFSEGRSGEQETCSVAFEVQCWGRSGKFIDSKVLFVTLH